MWRILKFLRVLRTLYVSFQEKMETNSRIKNVLLSLLILIGWCMLSKITVNALIFPIFRKIVRLRSLHCWNVHEFWKPKTIRHESLFCKSLQGKHFLCFSSLKSLIFPWRLTLSFNFEYIIWSGMKKSISNLHTHIICIPTHMLHTASPTLNKDY